MKILFLAIAAAAAFGGSIRVAIAALTPQPSEVCYDALGNTRYVPVGEPCKTNEQKTKILPQFTDPDAADPQAQLQKQVADLTAKVTALQAQVNQAQEKQTPRTKVNRAMSVIPAIPPHTVQRMSAVLVMRAIRIGISVSSMTA